MCDHEIEIAEDSGDNDIVNDPDNDIDKPHNGKSIDKIEISPNEEYLVTYSKEHYSIVGWNAILKSEFSIKLNPNEKLINMCVSNDKKLVLISRFFESITTTIRIYDMMNKGQEIKLKWPRSNNFKNGTFNLKGELLLLLYNNKRHCEKIFIYSTQTKNDKWKCKRIYEIPNSFRVIGMSKYTNLYVSSDKSIYEWNFNSEKGIKVSDRDNFFSESDESNEIIYNNFLIYEKFTCIRIKDKIIIYSTELESLIVSLDINNDTQMYHTGLIPLLLPLLDYDSTIRRHFCNGLIGSESNISNIRITTKYVFGILDGHVLKFELKEIEEILLKMNLTYEDSSENIKNLYNYFSYNSMTNKKYDHMNIQLKNLIVGNMSPVQELFKNVYTNDKVIYYREILKLDQNTIIWEIVTKGRKIEISVYEKNSKQSICSGILGGGKLHRAKLLDDKNTIIVLTTNGLYICYFNESNEFISSNYYYCIDEKNSNLPSSSYSSFECCDNKWVSIVNDNKESFLKHGAKLLESAIKEHKLELIEEIYRKSIIYFEEDLKNNYMFLSIITSTMSLLNEYYPEYIIKYSSETIMIIDSPSYNIEHLNGNFHLYTYIVPHTIRTIQYFWLYKYSRLIRLMEIHDIISIIIIIILLLLSPIFLIIFLGLVAYIIFEIISSILFKRNDLRIYMVSKSITRYFLVIYSKLFERTRTKTPIITFMNPYIKFVNYPQDYNWFLDLIKPQPNPFVETINRDIYKTWSGETLINFKWDTYGKYYYAIIWIGFMALLGCFTAAATIPQQYIDDDIHHKLLIVSIILGFIHLSFEIRQFIYDPIKWIYNFWNIFDLIAFLLPIYTSIYWLQTNVRNIQLLSFSCLFLDIKFLLFFRAFEYFGVYFAIIISVAKQIVSFLLVLFIIIISFAHAFYILLSPESNISFEDRASNNDPNNPWNIASSYHQVFENGTVDPNTYMIQLPDENTNMFIDFGTSIFAIYLSLTGDSSALSNWAYKNNPSLVILIVLFSLLIVVYLMNLFIGLLNNAIAIDNNRVSYLIQKAEILAEIELFYLLPFQRRWYTWFPDVIYYYADVDKTRQKIKEMIKDSELDNEPIKIDKKLLDELNIRK